MLNSFKKTIAAFSLSDWMEENKYVFIFFWGLIFLVYGNSLRNGFISDDYFAIPDNKDLGTLNYFIHNPTFFVRSTFYFIVYHLFGLHPFAYRLINIFFHIGNVSLIYLFFHLFGIRKPIAIAAATIFAVHPLFSEPVVWISGGLYPQYSFFLLLSFIFYIFSYRKKGFYITSVILHLLALSSSDKALVYPFILFVYELSLGDLRKNWQKLTPFFCLSFLEITRRFSQVQDRLATISSDGSSTVHWNNPLVQIPLAITTYFQLIFWPHPLTFYHTEWFMSKAEYAIRATVFMLYVIGTVVAFKKNKMIFFWSSFFILSLANTLAPIIFTWVVAERYVYLGAIGIFFIIAYVVQKIPTTKTIRTIAIFAFIVLITVLSIRTIIRNRDWMNDDTMWIATAKTTPLEPKVHLNLGEMFMRQHDYIRARAELEFAIALKSNYADAYHALADIYSKANKTDEAIKMYNQALKYNPKLWQSDVNIAVIYMEQQNMEQAEGYMKKAIAINPKNPSLYANLAIIYLQMNKKEEGQKLIKKAFSMDPKNERAKMAQVVMDAMEERERQELDVSGE